MDGALAVVVCVMVGCGTGLAGFVLWLRARPACTRKEYEALTERVDALEVKARQQAVLRAAGRV